MEATYPLPSLTLVVIRSADLARAEAFYTALGLTFTRERHGAGPEHLVCQLGGTTFEIYPRAEDADGRPVGGSPCPRPTWRSSRPW